MSNNYILAYDFGTSGVKSGIFHIDGALVAEGYQTYETLYPAAGWAEERPEDWWTAFKNSTSEVLTASNVDVHDICAISFSSMGGATVPVDRNGNLLKENALVWMDARSTAESIEMTHLIDPDELFNITGLKVENYAMSLVARVKWIKKHEPVIYQKTYRLLGTPEFIILRLSGSMEYASCSALNFTAVYNIHTGVYDERVLKLFDMDPDKLCKPADITDIIGYVNESAAAETGIAQGTPIVAGSWDNMACVIGGGGSIKGDFVTYLGTAAWIGTITERYLKSKDAPFMTARAGKNFYYNSINSHSSGPAFDWVVNNIFRSDINKSQKTVYKAVEEAAMDIPAGSDGLFFMPSFYGGNSIYENPHMAGAFLGILPFHTKAHMIRAAMEGVGFDMMLGVNLFSKCNENMKKVRLIGGGAENNLWATILASMFDISIVRIKDAQHCGVRGAMMMAGIGIGLFKNLDEVEKLIIEESTIYPVKEWTKVYNDKLAQYRIFFEALLSVYTSR